MLEKLRELEATYDKLSETLGDPEIASSPEKYRKVAQAHAELSTVVEKYRDYKALLKEVAETKGLLEEEEDQELLEMARQEYQELEERRVFAEEALKCLLLPKDPDDKKNVILEIRAGTGGDEATLFAQGIFRMYSRYAEGRNWKVEVLSANQSSVGGFKEIIGLIQGENAYGRLKYESGVHRVQRVPETETQGRLHTSAVTVAILPEVDEVDVKIDPKELRVDRFCSSGPGGQSVNTTYSAIRITHIPTGEVVSCQDEKSQIKNKAKALKVLRSRLYEKALREQQSEIAETRRAMVGSGDRSEKIRTYNYPQNRVTDHRVGLSLHQLGAIMEGSLDAIIDALITSDREKALQGQKLA
jgi:peptide chain release factor 1